MINVIVKFRASDAENLLGVVLDKIKVLQLGGAANYDNYVVATADKKIHIVNPFAIMQIGHGYRCEELEAGLAYEAELEAERTSDRLKRNVEGTNNKINNH